MKGAIAILFFIFSLTYLTYGYSQNETTDNQNNKSELFPMKYGGKKWKFILGLDARRSFFSGVPVKINGLRTGLQLDGVHRFGLGFYGLSRQVVFTDIVVEDPAATDTSLVKFNVSYISLFYERVMYKSKKWELAIPTQLSGGSITGAFEDTSGTFLPLIESPFSAFNLAFQTKYYILPWLAPRASLGYRLSFNTTPEVKKAFNRPFYSFGVQLLLGELYRSIFRKEESTIESSKP